MMTTLTQRTPKQMSNWAYALSGFSAGYGVGLIPLLALPFLITGIMEGLHLNEAEAGLLMSAEFIFTMLSSLLISPMMGKIPRKTFAFIGTIIAIIGNIISANVIDVYTLFIIRSITGFGAGFALACGNACVASSKNPGRTASYMNLLFVMLMIIVMLSFSRALTAFGLSGLYYSIAIMMVLMMPFMIKMPQRSAYQVDATQLDVNGKSGTKLFSVVSMCMMATMFLFSVRDTMGWAFVGQVGLHVGYSDTELGTLFSAQTVLGLIGPTLAAIIGIRFGLSIPVFLGIAATGAVSLGYILGGNSIVIYTVSVMLIVTTYFYALAYLTQVAAMLDREGKIVAASSSFLTLGMAVGPAATGWLVLLGGYQLVGMTIFAFVILTGLFVIIPLKRVKQLI